MKHWINNSLAFLALITLSAISFAAPRVAIVDFEDRVHYRTSWHITSGAADMLTTELVKATDFEVFERERVSAVLSEQNFGQSGRIDPDTAAEIGRIIGVDYIITGAITEFGVSSGGGGGGGFRLGKKGYNATVDIRLVNVETGRIVFADSGSGSKRVTNVRVMGIGGGVRNDSKMETESMRLAIKDVTKKLQKADLSKKLKRNSKTGTYVKTDKNAVVIAAIDGTEVTLNKGSNVNIKVGQVFKVQRPTGTVKDPNTGKVIKVKYKKLGQVKITDVGDTYSDGVLLSNKGVEIGDIVDVPRSGKPKSASAPAPRKTKKTHNNNNPNANAIAFLAGMASTSKVRSRSDDVEIDAYDEDALEDYYEALKRSVEFLSSIASMTSAQYQQGGMNMSAAWGGLVSGQLDTAKIELEDWPLEIKQQGWGILGNKITKYNKLFNKHRKNILSAKVADENFRGSLSEMELVTEESLFSS